MARRARGAARVSRRRRVPRLRPRRGAARRGAARRGPQTSSSSGARSTPRRRGGISVACRAAGLELRLHGDQFTESGAIPLAHELGARSVDHLEATGPAGVRELAASDVVGVLLPASALFLGRPMPPGRALVDAGAAIALATDFNPGSSFTTSLPLVCSLAATQLKLAPAEALSAVTVNAAHVLGCAHDRGRIAEGYRADLVLLDAPDWRYLAYHLAGDIVADRGQGRRGRRSPLTSANRSSTLRADGHSQAAPPPREELPARVRVRRSSTKRGTRPRSSGSRASAPRRSRRSRRGTAPSSPRRPKRNRPVRECRRRRGSAPRSAAG